jgi:hypothetical protein
MPHSLASVNGLSSVNGLEEGEADFFETDDLRERKDLMVFKYVRGVPGRREGR